MKVEVELPDEVLRYFEFIPMKEISGIFAELLVAGVKERVTGQYFNKVFDGSEVLEGIQLLLPSITLSGDTAKSKPFIGEPKKREYEYSDKSTTYEAEVVVVTDNSSNFEQEGEDGDLFADMFK